MGIISVTDLSRIYRMGRVEVHALRNISVEIEKGEFIGVMGASGSGKSTFLHQIGLLDYPTSGIIQIDGMEVKSFSERARTQFRLRKLGFVFQDYALVPELTALENVFLLPLAAGVPDREGYHRSHEVLAMVGLEERVNHLPSELSGGEQQRAAIARSLINNPDIIMADEPCANLDSENSKMILDLFKQINQEQGQTIVMVSHEPEDIPYFDRVISLRDGMII